MSDTHHACFELANEKLGKKNTKLSFAMQVPSGDMRLVIGTEKVARGPKPLLVLASYCPFCGKHLP